MKWLNRSFWREDEGGSINGSHMQFYSEFTGLTNVKFLLVHCVTNVPVLNRKVMYKSRGLSAIF